MSDSDPILYFDLGSPYAYLAAERAGEVLGGEPLLEPILVGGIFAMRGSGSWAHTSERSDRVAEVELRAERYGLPAVCWPEGWPSNTLEAMRAAIWAKQQDVGAAFARAGFRAAFVEGRDLSRRDVLEELIAAVGLPAGQLSARIESPAVKEALKLATARAWERGVAGVPCVAVGDQVFYGDDRLEAAAERLGRDRAGS